MNIREFGETVEFNLTHNLRHAILGLGAPGMGKSQLIHQIGRKYGCKVIDLRLAQMSEVEIGGLIYPNADRTKTVWLSPDVLPDEQRDGPRTILLLDEITSCPKRVQVAACQLILDRSIGQYRLPEGTLVVALGNREDDDGVCIRLPGPLMDRFEIHYIDVDFDCWKDDYALPHGVHPRVVDYLTVRPKALHTQATAGDSMIYATPRSWDRVSEILKMDSDVNKSVIAHKIIGNVGEDEGKSFIAWCKQQDTLDSVDDYLAGKIDAPTIPRQQLLMVHALTQRCGFLKNCPADGTLTQEEQEKLRRVLLAMLRLNNNRFTMIGLRHLMELNREAVKRTFAEEDAPEMHAFIRRNSSLLGLSEAQEDNKLADWLESWRKK